MSDTTDNQTGSPIGLKRLSSNDDYYNLVFKKTERIASAVFYILAQVSITDINRVHHTHLSDTAMALHAAVSDTLSRFEHEVGDALFPLQRALVLTGSALSLAHSGGVVPKAVLISIEGEIDDVVRYLRHHYGQGTNAQSFATVTARPATPSRPQLRRRPRPVIPAGDFSSEAVLVYSDLQDRTTRIKTVLEAKPEATIKDLSEIITDVSTKTIQRDLNSLIESGEVIRQGERRWSKYSIAK
jgi:hypothetical protein